MSKQRKPLILLEPARAYGEGSVGLGASQPIVMSKVLPDWGALRGLLTPPISRCASSFEPRFSITSQYAGAE